MSVDSRPLRKRQKYSLWTFGVALLKSVVQTHLLSLVLTKLVCRAGKLQASERSLGCVGGQYRGQKNSCGPAEERKREMKENVSSSKGVRKT